MEIDKVKTTLAGGRTEPVFDPVKTSALLAADEPRRSEIENAIRELRHPGIPILTTPTSADPARLPGA